MQKPGGLHLDPREGTPSPLLGLKPSGQGGGWGCPVGWLPSKCALQDCCGLQTMKGV